MGKLASEQAEFYANDTKQLNGGLFSTFLETLMNDVLFIYLNLNAVPARWRGGSSVRFAVGRPGIHFPSRVIPKDFKKRHSQPPCLSLSKIGIVWRTSRQACLLCP